jgi:hypothetical protein
MRPHWPTLTILAVALWLFTTTGGSQVFVSDMLGEAYDSQAEHFLRGDVDVDGQAIRHEAMIVDGKARMYFGPLPALLRIPLNFVHPAGRGRWSRISVFCAAVIALCAFAALIRDALAKSVVRPIVRESFAIACLVAFAFASPLLLLLGEASIYNEATIWGLAGSMAALLFAFRSRERSGWHLTSTLIAFSISGGAALLARVSFGIPLLIVAVVLATRVRPPQRTRNLIALLLPIAAAAAFHMLLSYERFGSIVGVNYDYYINSTQREFARTHGIFRLTRVPYAFGDYFALRPPSLQAEAPFFHAERHAYGVTGTRRLISIPTSEAYISIPWCSAWLIAGALAGSVLLFRKGYADSFERFIAAALALECLAILAYFAIAQRYAADFYPFLVVGFVVFLRRGGIMVSQMRGIVIGLAAVSICVNTLTTISWLTECDQNVPAQTRDAWHGLLRR